MQVADGGVNRKQRYVIQEQCLRDAIQKPDAKGSSLDPNGAAEITEGVFWYVLVAP
jgi:hypothetical protein